MPVITKIDGREILDSRGHPALEVELTLDSTVTARVAVPSGASTGAGEALELRDQDPKRFFGKGLLKVLTHIENLSDRLKGYTLADPYTLDSVLKELDGTENKSHLGANTTTAVSLAGAKALSLFHKKELFEFLSEGEEMILPVPLINVLNGGVHANNDLTVQEFMIVPYGFDTFQQALQAGAEIFHTLKQILQKKGLSIAVGDEGGVAPSLPNNESAMILLLQAIKQAGYSSDRQVALALDVAASEFFHNDHYLWEGEKCLSRDLISIYKSWGARYPLISIEDGLAEDDWEGWELLTEELGSKMQLVGDDLFVTHPHLLQQGIERKAANCLLAKINQVGTLSEARTAIKLAHQEGYTCCISHRSGETEDTSLADLAVAWEAEQVKTGSVCRGERVAKYNRFLRIEEKLENKSYFAGKRAFTHLNKK